MFGKLTFDLEFLKPAFNSTMADLLTLPGKCKMFQRKTKSEFDLFHDELIERFWEIHEMEAYGGPPDFEIPPHKTESQILLGYLIDDIEAFVDPIDD